MRKTKVWKIGFAVLVVVAAYAGNQSLRLHQLRRAHDGLERIAAHFPRDYALGPADGRPLTYAVLGDSTAVGVGADTATATCPYAVAKALAARGFRVHTVVLAKSGARAADVLAYQLPELKSLHPNLISLTVGANDATHHTPADSYRLAIRELADDLLEYHAPVLVANTPDTSEVPALPWPANAWSGSYAARQNADNHKLFIGPRWKRVDLYGRGRLAPLINPKYYASDEFHPSDVGYAVWSGLFVEALPGWKTRR